MHLMWFQISHSWLLVSLGLYFAIMEIILSSGSSFCYVSILYSLWSEQNPLNMTIVVNDMYIKLARWVMGVDMLLCWRGCCCNWIFLLSSQARWCSPCVGSVSSESPLWNLNLVNIECYFLFPLSPFHLLICQFRCFNSLVLQMTVAFTSIMAIFIIERIDERKGMISLVPLVLAGIISIAYWRQAYYFIIIIIFNIC